MSFEAKAVPIVSACAAVNVFSVKRFTMLGYTQSDKGNLDLPTARSPRRTTLYASGRISFCSSSSSGIDIAVLYDWLLGLESYFFFTRTISHCILNRFSKNRNCAKKNNTDCLVTKTY